MSVYSFCFVIVAISLIFFYFSFIKWILVIAYFMENNNNNNCSDLGIKNKHTTSRIWKNLNREEKSPLVVFFSVFFVVVAIFMNIM